MSQLATVRQRVLITPGGRSVDSTRWSPILAQNRDFCLPRRHSTPPLGGFPAEYCHAVWYGKTWMVWLLDGEKIWSHVYSFWQNTQTWQTDRLTDGRTPYNGIGRACIASRGKSLISHSAVNASTRSDPSEFMHESWNLEIGLELSFCYSMDNVYTSVLWKTQHSAK